MAHDQHEADPPVPLRERRRTELRQRLSDTATALFLEHGFEAVTVADVARACGVTEKTVFNHFRSKESLLVDRWEEITAGVTAQLRDPSTPVLDGVLATLWTELDFLTQRGRASPQHLTSVGRFGALVASTPALLDHRRRAQQQLTAAVLAALAERSGSDPDDPGTQVTAEALSALFSVFYRSLGRHVSRTDAASCRRAVRADLRKAARRLARGISD
jgi:AcrR family transcriptional regulator